MRFNLFWKILLPLLSILACIALFIKFGLEPNLVNQLQGSIFQSTTKMADSISILVTQNLSSGCSHQKIDQIASALTQDNQVGVTIIIPNCELGQLPNFQREQFLNQTDFYKALGGQTIQQIKPSSLISKSIAQITKPLLFEKAVIGAIQIDYYFESVESTVSNISRPFYLSLFFLAIFAIGISYLIWFFYARRFRSLEILLGGIIEAPKKQTNLQTSIVADELEILVNNIKNQVAAIQEYLLLFSSNNKIFSSVLASMTDGILVVGQNHQVKLINRSAADFFDTEIPKAESHSIAEVIRNHDVEEIYEKCQQNQQVQMGNIEIIPNHRYIRCIATPLTADLAGSVLLLFQDLTRIHQLEIIRQDFVSNISHELRTPLASLKSLVETIQESAGKDHEATEKFLEMMNKEIDNLTQMVQELLELSRIESGKVPLQKELHSSDEIIEKAGERMRLQAKRAKLKLKMKLNPSLPSVMVDISRLEQVLVNLIHNSIKFTPPGGAITLEAKQQDHSIVFSVQDTGIGIPPKDLERIFERFYKVDRARTAPGTGLGLSIARHLVEAHGGKIWAESTQTKGSTFYFSIPIFD